ncbi:MAG: ABC transporter permease subunit [Clostridiales bacterium]|jgi:raffinose/stachyose/melibiose transport system permease protein|nr:ABC transporter permease subunit [Clostridiales bacterium]
MTNGKQKKLIAFIAAAVLAVAACVCFFVFNSYNLAVSHRALPYGASGAAVVRAADGNILAGYADGKLQVLDGGTAEAVSEYTAGGRIRYADSKAGTLVFCADDKTVHVVKNGNVSTIGFAEGITERPFFADFDENNLYVYTYSSNTSGRLSVYNMNDLTAPPVSVTFKNFGLIGLALYNGALYTANTDSQIVSYDAGLNEKSKQFLQASPEFLGAAAGVLLVTDRLGTLYAVDGSADLKQCAIPKNQTVVGAAGSGGGEVYLLTSGGNLLKYSLLKNEVKASAKTGAAFIIGDGGDMFLLKNGAVYKTDSGRIDFAAFAGGVKTIMLIAFVAFAVAALVLLLIAFPDRFSIFVRFFKAFGKSLVKYKFCYLAVLPTFAFLAVFNYFPAIYALVLSFTNNKIGMPVSFNGFQNFKNIFSNVHLTTGIKNTLIFLVTDVLKALIPSFLIAQFIIALRAKKLKYWTRVLLFVPGVLPGLSVILIWATAILGREGLVNALLTPVLGSAALDFLRIKEYALPSLLFVGFPWIGAFLIMYGALVNIPPSLHEAAKMDGCNWFRRIIRIDIPLIVPQLKYILLTSFIGSVQNYGFIFATTGGGPDYATYTISYEMFRLMNTQGDYGQASALSLLLFVVIFAVTVLLLNRKKNNAEEA